MHRRAGAILGENLDYRVAQSRLRLEHLRDYNWVATTPGATGHTNGRNFSRLWSGPWPPRETVNYWLGSRPARHVQRPRLGAAGPRAVRHAGPVRRRHCRLAAEAVVPGRRLATGLHPLLLPQGDQRGPLPGGPDRRGHRRGVFASPRPERFWGRRVIDGDVHDLRFLAVPGWVVGMSAKGKARRDHTGFDVHSAQT